MSTHTDKKYQSIEYWHINNSKSIIKGVPLGGFMRKEFDFGLDVCWVCPTFLVSLLRGRHISMDLGRCLRLRLILKIGVRWCSCSSYCWGKYPLLSHFEEQMKIYWVRADPLFRSYSKYCPYLVNFHKTHLFTQGQLTLLIYLKNCWELSYEFSLFFHKFFFCTFLHSFHFYQILP